MWPLVGTPSPKRRMPGTMANVAEKEKGYGSDNDSQHQVYERPKGLKGFYMHPVTQVRSQVASKSVLTM